MITHLSLHAFDDEEKQTMRTQHVSWLRQEEGRVQVPLICLKTMCYVQRMSSILTNAMLMTVLEVFFGNGGHALKCVLDKMAVTLSILCIKSGLCQETFIFPMYERFMRDPVHYSMLRL